MINLEKIGIFADENHITTIHYVFRRNKYFY